MWTRHCLLIATLLALGASAAQGATVLYVDDDALPGGDGLSWATAFNDLTDALFAADPSVCEIWVAAGVYTPTFEFCAGDARSVFQRATALTAQATAALNRRRSGLW